MLTLLKKLMDLPVGRRTTPRQKPARLGLEALEDRLVLSSTVLTTHPTTTSTTSKITATPTPTTTTSKTTSTIKIASVNAPTGVFSGTLTPGQAVTSANGQYVLTLQKSGNLVETTSSGTSIWSSQTSGVTRAIMQSDGNFVLANGNTPVWSTGTDGHPGAALTIQNNGVLVVGSGNNWFWTNQQRLGPNTTLLPGQVLESGNGQYKLTLQTNGDLVETSSSGGILWSSLTQGKTVTRATMQTDGNFVLYNGNTPVWSTQTGGHPGAVLRLQNDGGLVIGSGATWFWTTEQDLAPGSSLLPGQYLVSGNGQYTLRLQSDGNLVEYNSSGAAIWSLGTAGRGVTALTMQSDGNLVLYAGNSVVWATNSAGNTGAFLALGSDGNISLTEGGTPLWSSNSAQGFTLLPGQAIYSPNGQFMLTLQSDGNLVEYNSTGTPFWSSQTQGQHVTAMVMQGDGNLVLYNGNTAVWATNSVGHPGAELSLQNNGALIIYQGTTQVWAAQVNLINGQSLLPGQTLPSPNGLYQLTLQSDGNLVEYTSSGFPIWASGTAGKTVTRMQLQSNGNLVLLNGATVVWATNTGGHPDTWLGVQDDGNIDVYSGIKQLWTTAVETN